MHGWQLGLALLLTMGKGRRGKAEEVDDGGGSGKHRGRLAFFDYEGLG